jgi:hypothetical protein
MNSTPASSPRTIVALDRSYPTLSVLGVAPSVVATTITLPATVWVPASTAVPRSGGASIRRRVVFSCCLLVDHSAIAVTVPASAVIVESMMMMYP